MKELEDIAALFRKIPSGIVYLIGALIAGWILKKISTEERGPRRRSVAPAEGNRGKQESRDEQWPKIAEGIIGLYRKSRAVKLEAGVLEMSEIGLEILKKSGAEELAKLRLEEMITLMAKCNPENHDEILRWGVTAFFETDPGEQIVQIEGFLKEYANYQGVDTDIKLLGVLVGIYLRDEYMKRKGWA